MHDHIDHAVRQQILRALEPVGQLLSDRLLNNARTGETNQCARFRNVNITEHRVRRRDAARRRVGQNDDVGQAIFAQALHRNRHTRHLHQRQDTFLHASAARRRKKNERRFEIDGAQHASNQRFARRHAQRSGHETEILHCGDNLPALKRALSNDNGVVEFRRGLGVFQTIRIFAPVAKFEWILSDGWHSQGSVFATVEQMP